MVIGNVDQEEDSGHFAGRLARECSIQHMSMKFQVLRCSVGWAPTAHQI